MAAIVVHNEYVYSPNKVAQNTNTQKHKHAYTIQKIILKNIFLLCLRQARVAGEGIMFSGCPFILPSVRASVRNVRCQTIFLRRMNRYRCKLTQVVYGARQWNGQLLGLGGQKLRSREAETCFGCLVVWQADNWYYWYRQFSRSADISNLNCWYR